MKLPSSFLQIKSPILLGFLISLIGTLPLGYINIVSLQIYLEQGNIATILFILGVILVEFFVLKIISFAAKWLVQQKKLLLFIDVFTILFFLALAIAFYLNINNTANFSFTQSQFIQFPFFLGILLNSLNFMQWPYWAGIFIYLFTNKKLVPISTKNRPFIIGAVIGTFFGILTFTHFSSFILLNNTTNRSSYLNAIFVALFAVLAFVQLLKFGWKLQKRRQLQKGY